MIICDGCNKKKSGKNATLGGASYKFLGVDKIGGDLVILQGRLSVKGKHLCRECFRKLAKKVSCANVVEDAIQAQKKPKGRGPDGIRRRISR